MPDRCNLYERLKVLSCSETVGGGENFFLFQSFTPLTTRAISWYRLEYQLKGLLARALLYLWLV